MNAYYDDAKTIQKNCATGNIHKPILQKHKCNTHHSHTLNTSHLCSTSIHTALYRYTNIDGDPRIDQMHDS